MTPAGRGIDSGPEASRLLAAVKTTPHTAVPVLTAPARDFDP
jgi:hypothetical protein